MFEPDPSGVYATVAAAPVRRWVAYGVLLSLGVLLIYLAIVQPPAAPLLVLLIALGAAIIYMAERLRQATTGALHLMDDDIRDHNGAVLVPMAEIRRVERGAFALKPSNGFTLILTRRQPRAWAPGLWWRFGKRIGVGGAVSAAQAKFMAEQIAMRIALRDGI